MSGVSTVLQDSEQARIMVVDDQPANLKLMEHMLRREGYSVQSFPRGRLALASAATLAPDLVLLDINMPEMDGFAVCELLKADLKLASIPVIFLSALSDPEDKVRAFQCGGVDYVTKPFNVEEIRARVRAQLQLRRLRSELEQHAATLEDTVASRTRELMAAQRRLHVLDEAKSDFLKLISHELRTPLNGLLGISQLALEDLPDGTEKDELQGMFEQSRERLLALVENALLLTEIRTESESFRPVAVSLETIVLRAVVAASRSAQTKEICLEEAADATAFLMGDEDLIARAVEAMLTTALKFSPEKDRIRVEGGQDESQVKIVIRTGAGSVPDAMLPRFFDLFSFNEAVAGGIDVGLDLAVAQRVIALFGGAVTVENREPCGIQLTASFRKCGACFSLPAKILG